VKETIIRVKTATHASDGGLKSTVQKEFRVNNKRTGNPINRTDFSEIEVQMNNKYMKISLTIMKYK
jgi:hypothetical protein